MSREDDYDLTDEDIRILWCEAEEKLERAQELLRRARPSVDGPLFPDGPTRALIADIDAFLAGAEK